MNNVLVIGGLLGLVYVLLSNGLKDVVKIFQRDLRVMEFMSTRV